MPGEPKLDTRAQELWDLVRVKLRRGKLKLGDNRDEADTIDGFTPPTFQLGEHPELPTFSPKMLLRRFLESSETPIPKMFQKLLLHPSAIGLMCSIFWYKLCCTFRSDVKARYLEGLFLNMCFHFAALHCDVLRQWPATAVTKFGGLVSGIVELAYVLNFPSCDKQLTSEFFQSLQADVVLWFTGLALPVEDTDFKKQLEGLKETQAQRKAALGVPQLCEREQKQQQWEAFCSSFPQESLSEHPYNSSGLTETTEKASARKPLLSRAQFQSIEKAQESGSNGAIAQRIQQVVHNINIASSASTATEKEERPCSRRLSASNLLQLDTKNTNIGGRRWKPDIARPTAAFGVSSVSPLLRTFSAFCTPQSLKMIDECADSVSAFKQAGVGPFMSLISIEGTFSRVNRLGCCPVGHELDMCNNKNGGEKYNSQCSVCQRESAIGQTRQFLYCFFCKTAVCRLCLRSASSVEGKLGKKQHELSPSVVFGPILANELFKPLPPKGRTHGLFRRAGRVITLARAAFSSNLVDEELSAVEAKLQHVAQTEEEEINSFFNSLNEALETDLCPKSVDATFDSSPCRPTHTAGTPTPCCTRSFSTFPRDEVLLGSYIVQSASRGKDRNLTPVSFDVHRPLPDLANMVRPASAASFIPTGSRTRGVADRSVLSTTKPTTLSIARRSEQTIQWTNRDSSSLLRSKAGKPDFVRQSKSVTQHVARVEELQRKASREMHQSQRDMRTAQAKYHIEYLQEMRAGLEGIQKTGKQKVQKAMREALAAMEKTVPRMDTLDEIDTIKEAFFVINDNFEQLPETVKKHVITFISQKRTRLGHLVHEYKMQHREFKHLWPKSLNNMTMTRAMEAELCASGGSAVAVLDMEPVTSKSNEEVEREEDPLSPEAVAKLIELHTTDDSKLLAVEEARRKAELELQGQMEREAKLERIVGLNRTPVYTGDLYVMGGTLYWDNNCKPIGASAQEFRAKVLAARRHRD